MTEQTRTGVVLQFAGRRGAHGSARRNGDAGRAFTADQLRPDAMPVSRPQIPTHDGAVRSLFDGRNVSRRDRAITAGHLTHEGNGYPDDRGQFRGASTFSRAPCLEVHGDSLAMQNAESKHCLGAGEQTLAMHIGQRIKKLMADRKVTTAAMAKHCEVSAGAVSNWFSTGRISKENLVKAAALLNVRVEDLISGAVGDRGTQAPPPPPPDFADRHEVSESDWALLQDLKLLPEEDRDELIGAIRARAKKYAAFFQQRMRELATNGPSSPSREQLQNPEPVAEDVPRKRFK